MLRVRPALVALLLLAACGDEPAAPRPSPGPVTLKSLLPPASAVPRRLEPAADFDYTSEQWLARVGDAAKPFYEALVKDSQLQHGLRHGYIGDQRDEFLVLVVQRHRTFQGAELWRKANTDRAEARKSLSADLDSLGWVTDPATIKLEALGVDLGEGATGYALTFQGPKGRGRATYVIGTSGRYSATMTWMGLERLVTVEEARALARTWNRRLERVRDDRSGPAETPAPSSPQATQNA